MLCIRKIEEKHDLAAGGHQSAICAIHIVCIPIPLLIKLLCKSWTHDFSGFDFSDITELLKSLYEKRKDRLSKCGLEISFEDLLVMYR